MIIWAGNLFSLNRTLSGLGRWLKVSNILQWQMGIYCSCANSCCHIKSLAWYSLQCAACVFLLRKSLCLSFGNKEGTFVFMISIFCFITINIALDVYESHHALVKNIALRDERSLLTFVVIRYCGEPNWSCVGWRAALTPPTHVHEMRTSQVSRARKSWRAEATGVSLVLHSLC